MLASSLWSNKHFHKRPMKSCRRAVEAALLEDLGSWGGASQCIWVAGGYQGSERWPRSLANVASPVASPG
ncbi:hypothetical protein GOP47_0005437 [Adiantum capillus-veneris]|uniref:Uncharacterized protein n=1 Tax=Adiantum capillus-veneris TaxID=13818 RepID=A0A9D4ZLD7_ADICA|nr:hypothetical protein GOP47_0005437 [Adiantum capillus-veneris]